MYIINEQKEEMNMLYTVSGRTPSGTFTRPKGEAVDIIDGLVEIAQTRQLTSSESDQLHAAKMALPTFAEERAAAVQRIKERVEKRRHES